MTMATALVLVSGLMARANDLLPQPTDPDLTMGALLRDPATPTGGNPKGDVTIVEFFDYNCPFCMKSAPVLKQLLRSDHGIRMVYKDWPIFGPVSKYAAQVALAAKWQGDYQVVHDALLATGKRKFSREEVRTIAATTPVDMARLKADLVAHKADIDAIMARTEKQADRMHLPGTPIFLVGPLLVNQALDLKDFKAAVAQARAKQAQAH
ncbi:MAG: DsbA family protein [Hyphomicrobiales bacterium]|nr:DsbA family protein [Hyphomicrobiales bacterium]